MSATITLTTLTDWLAQFSRAVAEQQGYLTELDSAIGDADHGANMARGMSAVMEKIAAEPSAAADEMLKKVGLTLVTSVGGASGPLYGTFFIRMSSDLGDVSEFDAATLGSALHAGLDGLVQRGKPELGDKTMYDALAPAFAAYDAAVQAGEPIADATAAAAAAAAVGRDATEGLIARKGRASYLGERSIGHIDPGSASAQLLVEALAKATSES